MRVCFIAMLVSLCLFSATDAARAQKSNACAKDCGDYMKACRTAHSAQACKSEYDICMIFCKKK
jgi:hypothetical protein